MQVFVYSMYDRVSHSYGDPFTAIRDEIAQRRFNYIMSQSPMVAQDMQLFKIATFDIESGVLVPCNEFICNYDVKEDK